MGVNGNNSKMDKTRKIQLKQSAVWQYFVVRLCANTIKIMLLLIDVSAYYLYLYVQMCITNMHQRMVFIMFDLNSTNKCLNINKQHRRTRVEYSGECSCGLGKKRLPQTHNRNFFESDFNLEFSLCFKLNAWRRNHFARHFY